MSDFEEAIARAQLKGDAGTAQRQTRTIAYLNDRVFVILGVILFAGLCLVWATAKSTWVLYGSLALTIVLVIFWGIARVKRLDRIKQERAEQARSFSSQSGDS